MKLRRRTQSALNFHQVVNMSERKNSSFRQKKFHKIEYFFSLRVAAAPSKISSSKRILNISKKRETVFLRNLQMEEIGQRVTKREKDHVLS